MRTVWLAAFSTAVSLSGALAATATPGPDVSPQRWTATSTATPPHPHQHGQTVRDSGAAEFLQKAVHRRQVRTSDGKATEVFFSYYGVLTVPDIDGDRLPDVVTVSADGKDTSVSTVVTAHRGATGKTIWSKTYPTLVFPVPAKVGPKAVSGFFLLTFDAVDLTVGYESTLTVTATDARTTPLWTTSYNGAGVSALLADAYLAFPGVSSVARMTADASEDLLLVKSSDEYDVLSEQHAATVEVISGADGKSAATIGPVVMQSGFAYPTAIDDITGDKLADIALGELNTSSSSGAAKLTTYRGTDGTHLWTAPGDYYDVWLSSVPDMTGDHRADLVITPPDGGSRLLNGATGATVWSRHDQEAWPVGDINHDGKGELLVSEFSGTATSQRLTISVVDGSNRRLWSHPVVMNHDGARLRAYPVGDLQPDGVEDVFVMADFQNKAGEGTHHFVLDGKTGRTLFDRLPKNEYGAYAAVDGRGDDLIDAELKKDRPVVTVHRGENGRPLWSWTGPAGTDPPDAYGTELTGDGHAEVVLISGGFESPLSLTVLDGRTGHLRWRA